MLAVEKSYKVESHFKSFRFEIAWLHHDQLFNFVNMEFKNTGVGGGVGGGWGDLN